MYYHRLPVGDVAPDGKRRNNRKAAGGLSSDGEVTNAVDATKAKEEDKEAKEAGEGSANASQEGKEDVGPDESDDGVPCWTYVAHRTTHPIIREVTMTILCRHVDTAAPGSLATVAGRWPPVATASASAGAREDPSSASMAAAVTEKGSGRPPLHPSLRFPLDPLAYFESLCEVASGRFWREPLHELGGNATLLGFGRPHVNVTHAPTTGVGGNRRHSYTPGSTAASSGGGGTATVLFVPVSRRRALRMLGRDVQLSGTVFERRVAVLLTAEEARVARGWGVVRVLGLLAERAVARTWEERVRGELPRAGASVIDGEAEQKEGVESKVESKKDEDDDENGAADGDASGSGNGDGTSSHSTADEGAINTARFPIWVEPNRPSLLTAAEMEDSTKGMDEGMVQIFVPGIRVFRVRTLGAKKSAAAETSIEMTVDADVDDDADTEDDGDGPRQPTATRRPASTPGTTTIALRITRMVRHREQFQHLFASLSPMSTVAIDSTWYEDANGVLTWNRDNDAAPSVVRFAGTEAEEREELCVGSLIVGPRVAAAKPGDAEGVNDPMEGRDVVSYYEDGVRCRCPTLQDQT